MKIHYKFIYCNYNKFEDLFRNVAVKCYKLQMLYFKQYISIYLKK